MNYYDDFDDELIPVEEHEAAVAAARATGYAEGYAESVDAERARLAAIIAGCKGDAARAVAALELAGDAPDMTAAAVLRFVKPHAPVASSASLANRDHMPDSLAVQRASLENPGEWPGVW